VPLVQVSRCFPNFDIISFAGKIPPIFFIPYSAKFFLEMPEIRPSTVFFPASSFFFIWVDTRARLIKFSPLQALTVLYFQLSRQLFFRLQQFAVNSLYFLLPFVFFRFLT